MKLDYTKYNSRIKEWTKSMVSEIRKEAGTLGVVHRNGSPSKSPSLRKLSERHRSKDGIINQAAIKFPRPLIWTHKGAGKGIAGNKGSKWIDKYGNSKRTNPQSFGKMSSGSRRSKPFFNNIIDGPKGVEELAAIVAEETGDAIINNMLIK